MYKSIEENKTEWETNADDSISMFAKHVFSVEIQENEIELIQKFMHYTHGSISSSQIRNVYNLIIESSQPTSKRIKLAYIAGRTEKKKKAMHTFLEKLDTMLENNHAGIKIFAEACLAYHKYYDNMKIAPKQDGK